MSEESAFEVGRLYEPIKRIADTLSASQKDVFVRLPGLLAYWPMGIRTSTVVVEHAGSALDLSQTGTCPTGYDGNSFVHLPGPTNFLYNTSAQFGLDGVSTRVEASIRGLTFGGWFMVDSYPTVNAGIVTRYGAVTQYGYALHIHTTDQFRFVVSSTGSNSFAVVGQVADLGQWYFVACRFTPSVEVAIFVNSNKSVFTTAIPSSLHPSTQDFEIGRLNADNTKVLHGKARDVFVCSASLSDETIEQIRVTSMP